MGIGTIFIIAGALTAASSIFIYFYMIETKGKTPTEIEELFY
jgi:hypothetical protein